eukprot:13675440-Alexandrium_andersonii.AAC.1
MPATPNARLLKRTGTQISLSSTGRIDGATTLPEPYACAAPHAARGEQARLPRLRSTPGPAARPATPSPATRFTNTSAELPILVAF